MKDAAAFAARKVPAESRPHERKTADGHAEAAARAIADALRARPSAIVSDIDGTLSPLVATPQDATVLAECRAALQRLTAQVDVVCLLTGRPADEAWRMVGVDDALYIGNHGVESWLRGALLRPAGSERYHARLGRALAMLRHALADVPALVFEHKGLGFAVHYRRAPKVGAHVLETTQRIVGRRGLEVFQRTLHVEVRVPIEGDKGSALMDLARRHDLRGLVVLGDDEVDLPAFDAARRFSETTGARCQLVAVGPRLIEHPADVRLSSPAEAGAVLARVAAILEQ